MREVVVREWSGTVRAETARYYDFDDRYLVDRGPVVRHYDAAGSRP